MPIACSKALRPARTTMVKHQLPNHASVVAARSLAHILKLLGAGAPSFPEETVKEPVFSSDTKENWL